MKKFSQLTIPYIVWIVLMIVLPMLLIAFYSVTDSGNGIVDVSFTFDNYKRFFTDPDFLIVLWRSVKIAIKTASKLLLKPIFSDSIFAFRVKAVFKPADKHIKC